MISQAKRKFLLLTSGRTEEANRIEIRFNARTIQACMREGLVEHIDWPSSHALRLTGKGLAALA